MKRTSSLLYNKWTLGFSLFFFETLAFSGGMGSPAGAGNPSHFSAANDLPLRSGLPWWGGLLLIGAALAAAAVAATGFSDDDDESIT